GTPCPSSQNSMFELPFLQLLVPVLVLDRTLVCDIGSIRVIDNEQIEDPCCHRQSKEWAQPAQGPAPGFPEFPLCQKEQPEQDYQVETDRRKDGGRRDHDRVARS